MSCDYWCNQRNFKAKAFIISYACTHLAQDDGEVDLSFGLLPEYLH